MTKKHFIAIAEILAHNMADKIMVQCFADYFETQNPAFDRDRFFTHFNATRLDMEDNV